MKISVVICTYSLDRYEDFCEAVDSVLRQTYDDLEVVIVVDGTESVYERVREDYGSEESMLVHCNDENIGLLESRNRGAELASGEVVAFIDDDVIADEKWVAELVRAYEEQDTVAVGGKMTAEWVAGKPGFLPEEFYWLVGVTHHGFADGPGWVRNTFGSNISFRRSIFLELGGFDSHIGGRKGDNNLQGGETELCVRMKNEYDKKVWYNPEARVAHKVFEYRINPQWLLSRAFWQGYSKRAMEVLLPESGNKESEFLAHIIYSSTPKYLNICVKKRTITGLLQLLMLYVFAAMVGFGYLYCFAKYKLFTEDNY